MQPPVDFREALRTWARIGLLSFGGPAGQIATMHRILVEEKRWISSERFLHALSYCTLLPGPEAQQLATYVGWLLHRVRGGLAAGLLFVLPGFVVMMGLAALYATFGRLEPIAGLFLGLKAAVMAVVVEAVIRVGRRTLASRWLALLAAASFLALFAFDVPFPAVVVSAALVGLLARRLGWTSAPPPPAGEATDDAAHDAPHARPSLRRDALTALACLVAWWLPVLIAAVVAGPESTLTRIGLLFSKVSVVSFGGAYAVLAYVAQQAVDAQGWLSAREMMDGLGLAETTPGPLVLVLQFVGFLAAHGAQDGLPPLLAGVLGATMAAWVTFAPSFLWILVGAPHVERLRRSRWAAAALQAIMAAVVGVILNLAAWFSLHVLFRVVREREFGWLRLHVPEPASVDAHALLLAALAAWLLLGRRWPMLAVLATCAGLGLVASWI